MTRAIILAAFATLASVSVASAQVPPLVIQTMPAPAVASSSIKDLIPERAPGAPAVAAAAGTWLGCPRPGAPDLTPRHGNKDTRVHANLMEPTK